MNSLCETTANRFIDLKFTKLRSLLPRGEGQDEGIYNNSNLSFTDSLTPALSLREGGVYGTYMDPSRFARQISCEEKNRLQTYIRPLIGVLVTPGPDGFCPLSISTAVRLHSSLVPYQYSKESVLPVLPSH